MGVSPVGVSPAKGHKDEEGAGASVLCRQAERDAAIQPGDEKDLGRHYCGLPVLKGGLQNRSGQTS